MKTRFLMCAFLMLLVLMTPLLTIAQDNDLECPDFPDSPDDVRIGYYMGEGAAYYSSSQLFNAVNSFSCIIEQIDSNYLPAYMSRAAVYASQRSYDLAVADYTHAIQLDGSVTAAYNNRAIVYVAQLEYEKAMSDLNKVLDLDANNVLGHTNRAVLYGIQDNYDAAIADLEQAIELSGIEKVVTTLNDSERPADAPFPVYDRDHAQAYSLLGIIYSSKALDNYRKYLLLTGSSGDARIQSMAGSLESRFNFDLRLDDGTWLLVADFVPEG